MASAAEPEAAASGEAAFPGMLASPQRFSGHEQEASEVEVRKLSKELRTPSRNRPEAAVHHSVEDAVANEEGERIDSPEPAPLEALPDAESSTGRAQTRAKRAATWAKRSAVSTVSRLHQSGRQIEWRKVPGQAVDGMLATGRWMQVTAKLIRDGGGPGMPQMSVRENLLSLPWMYCEKMGRVPYVFVIVYIVLFIILIGVPWRRVVISTNLDDFRSIDAPASRAHFTYLDAVENKYASANSSTLEGRAAYQVNLFYEAKFDHVFSEASLTYIRSMEQQLRNLPGWQRLCNASGEEARFRCEPGESLINFAWPVRTDLEERNYDYFHLSFDGRSDESLPVTATLAFLEEAVGERSMSVYLPEQLSEAEKYSSRWLRSVASFTAPPGDEGAYKDLFDTFIAEELFPKLRDMVDRTAEEQEDLSPYENPIPIRVFFRGTELSDYEVRWTLGQDCKLAIGILVLIWLVMSLLSHSALIGLAMMINLLFAVAVSYVVVIMEEVGIASFLGIFLVLVLGTDPLLNAVHLWRRAGQYYPGPFRLTDRIAVLITSLVINIAPELLTACAFAVLLASSFVQFRAFGLHMVVGIAANSILAVFFLVPAIVANEVKVTPFLQRRAPKVVRVILEPEWCQWPTKLISRAMVGLASRGRRPGHIVIVVAVVSTMIFFISAVCTTVLGGVDARTLPQIFHHSHQREVGREAVEAFPQTLPSVVAAPNETIVCGLDQVATAEMSDCGLHWCEAPLPSVSTTTSSDADEEAPQECSCFTRFAADAAETQASSACPLVNITLLMSGLSLSAFPESELRTMVRDYVIANFERGVINWYGQAREVSPLVLEHWESGRTDLDRLVESAPGLVSQPSSLASFDLNLYVDEHCNHQEICHCGLRSCQEHPGFVPSVSPLKYSRRLQRVDFGRHWRRLQEDPDTAGWTSEVVVVFGINKDPRPSEYFDWTNYLSRSLQRDPRWHFDGYFDVAVPAAQRDMLTMCTDFPLELQVHSARCWIAPFKDWLQEQGERFPLDRFEDFQAKLSEFLAEYPEWAADMWVDEDGRVQATRFFARFSRTTGSNPEDILQEKEAWNSYVYDKNFFASTLTNNAWATSIEWVVAEAQDAALLNAWLVAALAVLATFLAGLVAVRDVRFIGTVILVNLAAVCGLAFCVFCVFLWRIGPWEVMLLTLLFCYSCRPAFRMGREYFAPRREAMQGEEAEPLAGAEDPSGKTDYPGPAEDLSPERRRQHDGEARFSSMQAEAGEEAQPVLAATGASVSSALGIKGATLPRRGLPQKTLMSGLTAADVEEGGQASGSTLLYLREEEVLEIGRALDVVDFGPDEGAPEKEADPNAPKARVQRALGVGVDAVLTMGTKMMICGVLMLPCRLSLFSRLGAVTAILPLFIIPCNLLVLPASLLLFGPHRCNPDLEDFSSWSQEAVHKWFFIT